jgi:hypothetical protein
VIQPYVIGWLVPTILAAVAGYLGGQLRKVKEYKRKMDDDRRTLDELTLMVCRMSIYDEHFSTDEKVDAYRIYREKGGNHQTKKYMDELLGEDADAYLARHSK